MGDQTPPQVIVAVYIPFVSRRMTEMLKAQGHCTNRKRVQRLVQEMDLEAIYSRKNLSQPGEPEVRFPYLMNSLKIDRPNKAWSADITYIPLKDGFGYCVAVNVDLFNMH
jgi:putative transposase